jgi:hypothetical protein
LTQWPCWFLFQKYDTGMHSSVLAMNEPTVHSAV